MPPRGTSVGRCVISLLGRGAQGRLQRAALAALLIAGCAGTPSRPAQSGTSDKPALPPLAFDLPLLGGGSLNAQTLRGKYVVLKPFAAWCVPCKSELPLLIEASSQFKSAPVAFVGVSFDKEESAARQLVAELKIPFPVVEDLRAQLAPALALRELSPVYLYEPGGELLARYPHCNRSAVEQLVQTLHQRVEQPETVK